LLKISANQVDGNVKRFCRIYAKVINRVINAMKISVVATLPQK